jgi:hypothetical protein
MHTLICYEIILDSQIRQGTVIRPPKRPLLCMIVQTSERYFEYNKRAGNTEMRCLPVRHISCSPAHFSRPDDKGEQDGSLASEVGGGGTEKVRSRHKPRIQTFAGAKREDPRTGKVGSNMYG